MCVCVLATNTAITSCKDYDDDVDNLQGQIDDLNGKGTTFDGTLKSLQDALNKANADMAAAQQKLTQADSDIKAAQAAAQAAQAAGDEAAAAAAQAKEQAAAAQQQAAAAQEAAAAAQQAAIAEAQRLVDELKGQIPDVSEFVKNADLADYAKLSDVTAQLEAIKAGLATDIEGVMSEMGLSQEAIDAMKNLESMQTALSQLQTQMTALENFKQILGENGEKLDQKLQENLQAANDAIDGKVAELTAALQNYVKSEDLTATLQNYVKSEDLDGILATQLASALAPYTTTEDLNAMLEGYCTPEQAAAAIREAVKDSLTQHDAKIKEQGTLIEGLDERVSKVETDLGTKLDGLNEALTKKIDDDIAELTDKVGSVNADLVTLLGKSLRSLVFIPNLYVGGIESVEYGYMNAEAYVPKGKEANTTNSNGENVEFVDNTIYEYPVTDKKYAAFNPVYEIEYHMNPSSAVLPENSLSFVTRDVQVVARAAGSKVTIDESLLAQSSTADGILTVPLRITNPSAITTRADGSDPTVNIFALQAKVNDTEGKDTVITSDYAGLYASQITPKAIAFSKSDYDKYGKACDGTTKPAGHLYTTATEALKDADAVPLMYGEEVGGQVKAVEKDLTELLAVHYTWNTATTNKADHGVWNYGDEKAYDLHYTFSLVDYTVGANKTHDSKYATINPETGVITAHDVNEDGSAGEPNKAAVGREPLVRVTVENSEDKVVLYGYLKIKITEAEELPSGVIVADAVDAGTRSVDDCADFTTTIDWSHISDRVLSKLGIGNQRFNENYELDKTGDEVNQFMTADGGNTFTAASPKYGKITESFEGADSETSTLTWTLGSCDQQKLYKKGGSYTTYVRYKRKGSATDEGALYLPITVTFNRDSHTAKPFNEGTQWTKNNSVWGWSKEKSFGINVEVPSNDPEVDDKFEQNFMTAFLGEKFNGYTSEDFKLYFIGGYQIKNPKGGNWNIVVENNNAVSLCGDNITNPTANDAKENPLDPEQGIYTNTKVYVNSAIAANLLAEIVNDTVIKYANTEIAKEVLNAYGSSDKDGSKTSDELDDPTLFLKVGIAVIDNDGCGTVVPLEGTTEFHDYVLRPLNLSANSAKPFVDASTNGSTLSVADIVSLSDWRPVAFSADLDLYRFYEVTAITIDTDPANVQTDLGGAWRSLAETAPSTRLEATPGTGDFTSLTPSSSAEDKEAIFGSLTYYNNGTPLANPYKLRIPVTVTYTWGTLTDYVEVTVNPVR